MAGNRITLTAKFVDSAKRIPEAGRAEFRDSLVPGMALRTTSKGHRSYVLIARFPAHPKHPTRRLIGEVGVVSLDEAREIARDWLRLIRRGIDPKHELAREKAENQRQAVTFGMLLEEYLTRDAARHTKAKETRSLLTRNLPADWLSRPLTDIRPEEYSAAIRATVQRGAPAQAHNLFAALRRMFSWGIGVHEFAIDRSPIAQLRPTDLIGARVVRERVLLDHELRAVWTAAERMAYPFGVIVQLLILTGQRLNEIGKLSWREIDFEQRLISIPGSRMKGSRAHEVPLAPDALALLKSVPRFDTPRGDFVFTTNAGRAPFVGFSRAKRKLDELSGVEDWVLHDLRRTARTHFSALPVQDLVRELVIAHARPGLHRIYDQHSYRAEKLELLTRWEERLRGILVPRRPISKVAAE
jgi:integrase